MIIIYRYNEFNKYDIVNVSKMIFKDTIFNLIGYIDKNHFVTFHTDKYLYNKFLNYDYYNYRLGDFIDRDNFNWLIRKSVYIPDIFKDKIDTNRITFDIHNSALKLSIRTIDEVSELCANINSSIYLTPKFIQNLQIEKNRIFELEDKIKELNYNKRRLLVGFYYYQKGSFPQLEIETSNKVFKNNVKFLNLFNEYYKNDKFNNEDVINLIRAIYRNVPKNPQPFKRKSEINIQHNGINLEVFRSHIWQKDNPYSGGFKFTNFGQEIELNQAINFLKMTPNFETFLYRLEKIHLTSV